jgi:hypothetical protein
VQAKGGVIGMPVETAGRPPHSNDGHSRNAGTAPCTTYYEFFCVALDDVAFAQVASHRIFDFLIHLLLHHHH